MPLRQQLEHTHDALQEMLLFLNSYNLLYIFLGLMDLLDNVLDFV